MSPVTWMRRRAAAFSDAFLTRLWPLPSVGVVAAVVVAVVLTRVDEHIDEDLPTTLATYIFGGDADAARSVLSAIAGSLITVTSLTFSLTVVTLQLASSQFSPRLLRTFTADRFVQMTLTLFLATFVYALTVLRTVRTGEVGTPDFVPRLSVTVGFVLTVASSLGLVLFLAHLVRQIRVETLLDKVAHESRETLRRVMDDDVPRNQRLPEPPAGPSLLTCTLSGFLTGVDERSLLAIALELDVVVRLDLSPGDAQAAGTPVGLAWSISTEPLSGDRLGALEDGFRGAVSIGQERTSGQDIGFGLRQVTDVATRALSPGINDPTTAVHALVASTDLLCGMVALDPGPRTVYDDQRRARVVVPYPDLTELLDLAVSQPRRYGASDPAVLAALFSLLRQVAWSTDDPAHHRAVSEQLERLRETAGRHDVDSVEEARLQHLARQVEDALAGGWTEG